MKFHAVLIFSLSVSKHPQNILVCKLFYVRYHHKGSEVYRWKYAMMMNVRKWHSSF